MASRKHTKVKHHQPLNLPDSSGFFIYRFMAKTNWAALQIEYIKAYARTGVTVSDWCKKKGLNFGTAKRYIKKPETAFVQNQNCETPAKSAKQKCETDSEKSEDISIDYDKNCETNCESDSESAKLPQEKCEISERTVQGSQEHRIKLSNSIRRHGGYARYFKDKSAFDVVKDFSLGDEIDLMRQRAVTAIESIEKFTSLLEKSESAEDKEMYAKLIKSAENSLDRAVARIESLNYTDNSIANMLSQIEHRKAMTKKTLIEADKLADEVGAKRRAGRDTVVYNIEY